MKKPMNLVTISVPDASSGVKIFALIVLLSLIISCTGDDRMKENKLLLSLKEIDHAKLEKLSRRKIYFGHQSVGYNIISGIHDIVRDKKNSINLNIAETINAADFSSPVFAHSAIGTNTDPASKIDAFANAVENGIGEKAEISFFKFCYVDVNKNTDINEIFNYYKSTMSSLRSSYPDTNFVHITLPLKTVTGFRAALKRLVKKLLGKHEEAYADNVSRNRFSDLMREEYKGKEPLFDLATIESTFLDGRRSTFQKDGRTYYALVPDYSNDGGHLNEKGRKYVAEQLLVFLAEL